MRAKSAGQRRDILTYFSHGWRGLLFVAAVLVCMGPFSRVVFAANAQCQASQLNAGSVLCQKILQCDSLFIKNSVKDPNGAGRGGCIAKAKAAFEKTYQTALAKAQKQNQQCGLQTDVKLVTDNWSERIDTVPDFLRQGWNSSDALANSVYASIEQSAAAFCQQLLKAEAANLLKPNTEKLTGIKSKGAGAFDQKVSSALAKAVKKGFSYSGHPKQDIRQKIDYLVNSFIETSRGNAEVAVAVNLPANILPASLTIETATQQIPVPEDGKLLLPVPRGSNPTLTTASYDGALVAVSLVFPEGKSNTFSCEQTAVSLVMIRSLLISLPPKALSDAFDLIRGIPSVSALTTTVCNGLALDPHYLDIENNDFTASLDTAIADVKLALMQLLNK